MNLQPEMRFDSKWSKTDLQSALNKDGLLQLWNELVKDGELQNRYNSPMVYGAGVSVIKGENGLSCCCLNVKTCSYCDGRCGCTCTFCHQLNRQDDQFRQVHTSTQISNSWTWGLQPSADELMSCLKSLLSEQQKLIFTTTDTLSSIYVRRHLFVVERYFVALSRQRPLEGKIPCRKKQNLETNLLKQRRSIKSAEKASAGLARVGSRAVLSFAFAFLRRAWRSGEDADLCSELLQESLEALRSLPEAILFDEGSVCSVWLEVVERASKFLRAVIEGDINGGVLSKSNHVPIQDEQTALALLLELSIQRATLSSLLEAVLLLLNLWSSNQHETVNRFKSNLTFAPLIPFLKRFNKISGSRGALELLTADECSLGEISPTECFLYYLNLPDDNQTPVDLHEAAVIVLAHLDHMAVSYFPLQSRNSKISAVKQDVLSWELSSSQSCTTSPLRLATVCEIGNIQQLVCSQCCIIMLTAMGTICTMKYVLETQVVNEVQCLNDKEVVKIVSHPESINYLALTSDGSVYMNRCCCSEHFQLKDKVLRVTELCDKHITQIVCNATHCAAITLSGDVYMWSQICEKATHIDEFYPRKLTELADLSVVDVALGNSETPSLILTNLGSHKIWEVQTTHAAGI